MATEQNETDRAGTAGTCPVPHGGSPAAPGRKPVAPAAPIDLRVLAPNPQEIRPTPIGFDYAAAFAALDLAAVKADVAQLLATSQPWWPADFGTYAPLMVRMAWHSSGTYRVFDGRGGAATGQQRFSPLNSWPDNVGLDKARRVLWPVKKKYGLSLSWADLLILAGTVALEQMGVPTIGFSGGREDVWEAEEVDWGSDAPLGREHRYRDADHSPDELIEPLAATHMGLIYVNPEGPGGVPDPAAAAGDIRETFARMSMNDEETIALIAGGHTFGKTHGAAAPAGNVGPVPDRAPLQDRGLGWAGRHGTGKGDDTVWSGLEVTWTYHPDRWDNEFFHILFGYEWECVRGEGGGWHWRPKDGAGADMVPFAHSDRRREPRMLTTDIALRVDPAYERISRRFKDDQQAFTEAFARAWFKLTHRDLGPAARYVGAELPAEAFLWQDPLPAREHDLIDRAGIAELSRAILSSGLTTGQLVRTAWASASSFRSSDRRGGANGARVRLEPQRGWAVNDPEELGAVLDVLETVREGHNETHPLAPVSLADVIVLGGCVAVQSAAAATGVEIEVPFTPGRTDATQEQTDVASFAHLEPDYDGFRNYQRPGTSVPAEVMLIDRARQLTLTGHELTALMGGLRVLGAGGDGGVGMLTDRPGVLTTDWFVNLLDLETTWTPADPESTLFEGVDGTGEHTWTGSRCDLVFASHSELRSYAEVYASDDAGRMFVEHFVAAWTKVTELDRYDLHR